MAENECVGEVSKTSSVTFECFEDFLQYEEYKRKLQEGEPVVPQMIDEETSCWIEWKGENAFGPSHVSGDSLVEVRLRDGTEWLGEQAESKDFWKWDHSHDPGDIIEYCVISK